jgi:hypothetical protein
MNEGQSLSKRIEELERAARQARLEAMRLAATIVTKSDALLAGPAGEGPREGELAVLKARYDGLVKMADDTQAQIDWLRAEEHSQKYLR